MTGPIRSVWRAAPPTPAPPRRVWRDWALIAVLVPIAVIEWATTPTSALYAIVAIALLPTLLWRRVLPLTMLLVAMGIVAVASFIGDAPFDGYTIAYVLVLMYSVFRWGSGRAVVIGTVVICLSLVISDILNPTGIGNLIGGIAVVLATIALGTTFRYRSSLRVRELDQARSLEREGLARDLHDTVAHHVSAIAIQAQAGLAMQSTDPDAAATALRIIETEASRTLTEMRAMVKVLRHDGIETLAPLPGIADLLGLASADGGTPVGVRGLASARDGTPVDLRLIGDIGSVPQVTAAAIYRLAQESITNARRHARAATRIDVTVTADAHLVTLTVHDDGHAESVAVPGYGITGMIERAALLGGTCTAGSSPTGWTVSAALPLSGRA